MGLVSRDPTDCNSNLYTNRTKEQFFRDNNYRDGQQQQQQQHQQMSRLSQQSINAKKASYMDQQREINAQ